MVVCFIGHRKIKNRVMVKSKLKKLTENLITAGLADTFLFGSKSEFNDLCLETVTELKENYPFIRRVYIRAEFLSISDIYKKYLLELFDETYFPERIAKAKKYVYVERNRLMIDLSDVCVFYYDTEYRVEKKNRESIGGGTELAYRYAARNKKNIMNIFPIG